MPQSSFPLYKTVEPGCLDLSRNIEWSNFVYTADSLIIHQKIYYERIGIYLFFDWYCGRSFDMLCFDCGPNVRRRCGTKKEAVSAGVARFHPQTGQF
jgi:hypothetical protein